MPAGRPRKTNKVDKRIGKVTAQLTGPQRTQLEELMTGRYRSPSLSHTVGLVIEDCYQDWQAALDRDKGNIALAGKQRPTATVDAVSFMRP